MARDDKRGKRGRRNDQPSGPPVGPVETDTKPTDAELEKLRPTKAEIRKAREVVKEER